MPETQETISAWAEQAFGASGSDRRVLARANEELAEAIRAETAGKLEADIAEEIADTMIVLCRYGKRVGIVLEFGTLSGTVRIGSYARLTAANNVMAKLLHWHAFSSGPSSYLPSLWRELHLTMWELGFDVQGSVDAKMAINRARKWKSDGNGHGYHLRDKGS